MPFPNFDPVIFSVGPLSVRWYGLMYLLGFLLAYLVINHLAKYRGLSLDKEGVSDLLFYAVIGVVAGGRLGYTLFYNAGYYLSHPLEIFYVWEGGMSFHGGLLGVVVALVLFSRRRNIPTLMVGDIAVTAAALGLGLGRLGNFINGELWGRVTDVPWAVIFPTAGPDPRHPSQLYEAALEGPLLFFCLWILHRRKVPAGVPFFCFFLLYGVFRFMVEFVRQPDAHLGFLWAGATMGQLLSAPMVLFGVVGLYVLRRRSLS
ncbi:MAG: prolipoprotein diacylglyceryl transferase [Desulfuromonas sp.]|nr:MAG: prolipoprotein diacylglyceryl transferase [Desulfuromonas sp.]